MAVPDRLAETLRTLFGEAWKVTVAGEMVAGSAQLEDLNVALIGTINSAAIGVDLALAMAGQVLDVVSNHPGKPILLLADNSGQKLAKRDELLGNAGYLAHLSKTLALARVRGHRTIALVYASALSGGFMATCMACDVCFAMPGTEVRVMRLDAMARITRIPLQRLEELTQNSPILMPDVTAFERLGAIEAIWDRDVAGALAATLRGADGPDRRDAIGKERDGRKLAVEIAASVQARHQ